MPKSKWRSFAEKGVKVMSEAADVAVHLQSNPGPLGLIAVGAKVINALSDVTSREASEFFHGWKHIRDVYPLDDFVCALCKKGHLLVDEKQGREGNSESLNSSGKVVTADLGGIKIGWTLYDTYNDGPYSAPGQDMVEVVAAIRVLIWQMMGNSVKFFKPSLGSPVLLNDSIDETLPSKTGDEIWEKQEKFIKRGKRRAVLIFGEPGTGKSHIIRHITDRAGGHRLRIRARDLESLRSLGSLIDFLRPSGVMIDDLDRAKEAEGIVEEFDEIKVKAKLFLVSVNVVKKLDPAVVRRFDDSYHIEKLDDEALDKMLEGIDPDIAAKLRELPITYIDKYREAHDVLGAEDAKKELDGLVARRELVLSMMEESKEDKDKDGPSETPDDSGANSEHPTAI